MMILRKISETTKTITLGWDLVAGAIGYRGARKSYVNADGTQRWSQAGPEAVSMKFTKDEWYRIEALKTLDSGTYPAAAPGPVAVYPSTTRYPAEVI